MENKSLYSYFGCNNKEELYSLIENQTTNQNEKISDLLDFYFTYRDLNKGHILDSPENVFNYISKGNIPKEDEIRVLSNTTKLGIKNDCIINIKDSNSEILRKIYSKGVPSSLFFVFNEESEVRKKQDIIEQELFLPINLRVLDKLIIDKDKNVRTKNRIKKGAGNDLLGNVSNVKVSNQEHIIEDEINYSKFKYYDEFSEYFSKERIKNLNPITQKSEIADYLKIYLQDKQQEYLGVLTYDGNYNIIDNFIHTKGGLDSSIVDIKVLLPALLDYKVKGVQLYHNHPSSDTRPSEEDKNVTLAFNNILKKLDKEITEHYIVGRNDSAFLSDYLNELSNSTAQANYRLEKLELIRKEKEAMTLTTEEARKLNILDVARSLDMNMLKHSRNEYYWQDHDSLKINVAKNNFYWYSRQIGGDTIKLVQTVKDVSFKEAMDFLETGEFKEVEIKEEKREPFEYHLGKYEKSFDLGRNYLREVRGLSDETIDYFLKKNVLSLVHRKTKDGYEEDVIVFKFLDRNGELLGGSLQGIEPNKERYQGKGYLKQLMFNSDNSVGFNVTVGDKVDRIIYFEAPIDMMSYYEMNKDKLNNVKLVAMEGLKEIVVARHLMEYFLSKGDMRETKLKNKELISYLDDLLKKTNFADLEESKELTTIAVDNDNAGLNFIEKLKERGLVFKEELPPKTEGVEKSDWNDVLKIRKEESKNMARKEKIPKGLSDEIENNKEIQEIHNKDENNISKWIVDFNSYQQYLTKDYSKQELTKELLEELRLIDQISFINYSENGLYDKIYFSEIYKGKEVNRIRIDIGDGNNENQLGYKMLYEVLGEEFIEIDDLIEKNSNKTLGNIEDIKKDLVEQGQNKNVEINDGDLSDKQKAAPLPEGKNIQPLNDLSPNQTQSQPFLHFSITNPKMSRYKKNYHIITPKELRKLNRYSYQIQQVSKWYLKEVADSTIHYLYKDNETINNVSVKFQKDNFLHLTGIHPIKEGQTAEQSLLDFANGNGTFDNIEISNKGYAFQKLQVLPELETILETNTFYFDNLQDIDRYSKLNFSKAIKTEDKDLLLLFKEVDDNLVPASLMKVTNTMNMELENVQEKAILGIYREKEGKLEQISINEQYIKDNGKEMFEVLKSNLLEQQNKVNLEKDKVKAMGEIKAEAFKEGISKNMEYKKAYWRIEYNDSYGNIKNYKGTILTKDILDEIKELDKKVHAENSFAKFYFEKIENGVITERGRIDIGDGLERNQKYYNHLYNELEKLQDINKGSVFEIKEDFIKTELKNTISNEQLKQEITSSENKTIQDYLKENDIKGLNKFLKDGVKEYANSDIYKQYLTTMSKFYKYSKRNIDLVFKQNPNATVVASYSDWKNKFERQVKRGAKGIAIFSPIEQKVKDENGEIVLDENGKPKINIYFRKSTVFDVSQTEGKELPQPIYNLEKDVDKYLNIYLATKNYLNNKNINIEFRDLPDKMNGAYSSEKNLIVIRKDVSQAQSIKTLFHELAHSQLHSDSNSKYGEAEYKLQELEAESIAFIMSNHYGIDTSDYTFGYLHGYIQDKQNYEDLDIVIKNIHQKSKELITEIDKSLEKIKNQELIKDPLQRKIENKQKDISVSEVKSEKKQEYQQGIKQM